MKKILLMVVTVLFFFCSCDDSQIRSDQDKNTFLSVTKVGVGFESLNNASKSDFSSGDEIGLFINSGQGWDYKKLTFLDSEWRLNIPVSLSNNITEIYASFPYINGSNNPQTCMIEHASQTDYLFSKQHSVTSSYPALSLKMTHALALIEFEFEFGFNSSPNSDIGQFEFIAIEGWGLKSKANVDLLTGNMEYIEGEHQPAVVYSWQLDTPLIYNQRKIGLMVLPVNKVEYDGEISVNMVINAMKYHWPVAAGTRWESGKKYIYRVHIRERYLEVIDVQIQDWIDAGKDKISLPYYG